MSSDGMNPDPGASQSGPMQVDSLTPGEIFDRRYRIVKKIGEGGMGEVYSAEHITLQKRVAIKLLRPEIVSNVEAVKRFRQEATSSSSIGHPNIIRIEDFADLPDGRIYLCMEYLDGAPLNDLLKQNALSPDRLLNVLIQTGHGLSAAHAKGIVHRDMKPENIFVTRDQAGQDIPKILDFGIAKVAGNDGQNHLTRTGTIFGTPFYMAPEQALGQNVDGRVDIYAMGVILYECFTGSLPFRGESFMGILTQHITTPPEPAAQRAAAAGRTLPPGMDAVIARAMVKEPEQRYQRMDDMVQQLVQIYRVIAGSGMSAYMDAYQPKSGMYSATGPAQMPTSMTPPPMGAMQPGMQPGMGPMQPMQSGPSQPYMPAADSSMMMEQPKKSKVGLIFLIIAILAVVGGGAAIFVVMNNKSSDAASTGTGTGTGTASASASGNGSGTDVASASGTGTASASGTGTASASGTGTTLGSGIASASGTGTASASGTGTGTASGSQVALITPDAGVPEVKEPDAGVAKPTPITVIVDVEPTGTVIWENGKKIDRAPVVLQITPGETQTIVAKKKGFKDLTLTVDGSQSKVTGSLEKIGGTGGHGTGPGTGKGTGTGTGTGKGTGETEDPRKKLCKEHPDDPRCMLEP